MDYRIHLLLLIFSAFFFGCADEEQVVQSSDDSFEIITPDAREDVPAPPGNDDGIESDSVDAQTTPMPGPTD